MSVVTVNVVAGADQQTPPSLITGLTHVGTQSPFVKPDGVGRFGNT